MNDGIAEMQGLDNSSPDEAPTERPEPRPGAEKPAGGWSMPPPVFRQTSGHTPQRSQMPATTEPVAAAAAEPIALDIEPQPDLNEAVPDAPETGVPASSAIEEKGGRGAVWAIFTLFIIVVFVIAFSVGVYFLFFRGGGDSAF
ncbi:MAG: hypothetical protein IPM21_08580 [Acidobacteria bacterium]|nr:hypothetical protein [Acidobacteriota bacterium]